MASHMNVGSIPNLGSGVDLSKIPPLHQKRMLTFVNHFVITTVSFLNKFFESCESRLEKFDRQMQKLDAELSILEAKLNSIPGLEEVEIQVELKPANPDELDKPLLEAKDEKEPAVSQLPDVETDTSVPTIDEAASETSPANQNPILERYKKMIHFGVPLQAVKLKMQQEGVDPNLIDPNLSFV